MLQKGETREPWSFLAVSVALRSPMIPGCFGTLNDDKVGLKPVDGG